MYIIIKYVVDTVPVVEVALTKTEAAEQATRFLLDITHFEGEIDSERLKTEASEPQQGFWPSGSFVVARKYELKT